MNDFLSPDEIEKLFAHANEGNLPMQADREGRGTGGGKRTRWLRTVDFTRPTKFSTDQERRLRRLLDTFCQAIPQRVMAEHRLPIELEVIDVQQLTWTNAFKLVPDNSVYCTVETAPHEGRMLLTGQLPLLCTAVEGLLGGDATEVVRERELSDIDLILVRRLMRTLVEVLSGLWFDQAEVTLALTDVLALAETVQIAAGAEPTLALTMEARLHRASDVMTLLIPYAAIQPSSAAFSLREEDGPNTDPRSAAAVREGLERVDVTLRTEVADTVLTLEQVLALRPGDEIRLDGAADDQVTVFADRTPVHHGRAGRSGSRRAVQITERVEVEP
jgi:flagellar motor switch protein FliM